VAVASRGFKFFFFSFLCSLLFHASLFRLVFIFFELFSFFFLPFFLAFFSLFFLTLFFHQYLYGLRSGLVD